MSMFPNVMSFSLRRKHVSLLYEFLFTSLFFHLAKPSVLRMLRIPSLYLCPYFMKGIYLHKTGTQNEDESGNHEVVNCK